MIGVSSVASGGLCSASIPAFLPVAALPVLAACYPRLSLCCFSLSDFKQNPNRHGNALHPLTGPGSWPASVRVVLLALSLFLITERELGLIIRSRAFFPSTSRHQRAIEYASLPNQTI